jgi:hypothetical protein
MSKNDRTLVGHIGVDAGIVWIGDPCYVFHQDKPPTEIGSNWSEFCDKLDGMEHHKSFNYDLGHEGLGVCVHSGYGDGTYPVYATYEDGRVKSVTIEFMEYDDEGELEEEEEEEEE